MPMIRWMLRHIPRPWLIRASEWLRPAADLWYRGKGFKDPVNGKSYRTFLPYGYGQLRPHALSPGTLTLERHRALWLFLERFTPFFRSPQWQVLHIAPEQAFRKRFKKLFGKRYVTADLHSPLADVKADITNLPFESDSFDVVLCNHVLEHIPDDRGAMSELYRVMKPGGFGIFQVPLDPNRQTTFEDPGITDPAMRARLFGQYDHVRVYGTDFFDRLRQAGFDVTPYPVRELFSPEEIRLYALDADEIIPYVQKPTP
ncbi:MAG: methyltransferase domain-containing protein [Chlorobi bacterium]|nr:methyltransferase domain-containing protein [Chlorobiota bacterium]